jgi:hypothetical protein
MVKRRALARPDESAKHAYAALSPACATANPSSPLAASTTVAPPLDCAQYSSNLAIVASSAFATALDDAAAFAPSPSAPLKISAAASVVDLDAAPPSCPSNTPTR